MPTYEDPPIPTAVLGATGYVAGELIRLLAYHPRLRLRAAVSRSQEGGCRIVYATLGDVNVARQVAIGRRQILGGN